MPRLKAPWAETYATVSISVMFLILTVPSTPFNMSMLATSTRCALSAVGDRIHRIAWNRNDFLSQIGGTIIDTNRPSKYRSIQPIQRRSSSHRRRRPPSRELLMNLLKSLKFDADGDVHCHTFVIIILVLHEDSSIGSHCDPVKRGWERQFAGDRIGQCIKKYQPRPPVPRRIADSHCISTSVCTELDVASYTSLRQRNLQLLRQLAVAREAIHPDCRMIGKAEHCEALITRRGGDHGATAARRLQSSDATRIQIDSGSLRVVRIEPYTHME